MAPETATAQSRPINLIFAKGTDVGRKRGHNEDYVDAFRPSDRDKHRQKGELFIVADGMGGHQAGEVASETAVETTSREYYASPAADVSDALSDAIQKANARIYRLAQESPARAGMGTTAVAAVIRRGELYVANVGDSRAYLLRNGKLSQVTRDHSFVQEQIEAGILTPEEARTHPQRNVVTRALGSKPDVKVDTFGGKLEPGDTLLLCSDGLSEHVEDEAIAAMLRQYPPKEAVPRLIALANQRGGSDNITALAVQVGSAAGSTAVAGAVPPRQTVAAAPTIPDKTRQGLSIPMIAGLSAGGLMVMAAVVIGGLLLFRPELIIGNRTGTPTPTVSPLTTPTIMATATATPEPTSTPRPTNAGPAGPATALPKVGIRLVGPEDGTSAPPGMSVLFSWDLEVPEMLPDTFTFFLVKTGWLGDQALWSGTEMSCRLPLPRGEYQWQVELRSGDKLIEQSEHRTLYVQDPTPTPTPTSTPTFTPEPPTNTPSSGGGGGGGSDNGGKETKPPTATPDQPAATPTETKKTPEPPG